MICPRLHKKRCNFWTFTYLTDRDTYPQLPTQPKKIVQDQTNTVVFYGQTELSGDEKSKFEFEENKTQKNWVQDRSQILLIHLTLKKLFKSC